jgi:hypothetical protein
MRAVELAWGRPNLRDVRGDGTDVVEDWTWRSDAGVRRVVHFRAGLSTGLETLAATPETLPAPSGAPPKTPAGSTP